MERIITTLWFVPIGGDMDTLCVLCASVANLGLNNAPKHLGSPGRSTEQKRRWV